MEDKTIHTVPLLDDVERFLDFLPESSIAEILAQEEGLDHPSELTECLVRWMLHITARKPPQNRIRISGSDAQRESAPRREPSLAGRGESGLRTANT